MDVEEGNGISNEDSAQVATSVLVLYVLCTLNYAVRKRKNVKKKW